MEQKLEQAPVTPPLERIALALERIVALLETSGDSLTTKSPQSTKPKSDVRAAVAIACSKLDFSKVPEKFQELVRGSVNFFRDSGSVSESQATTILRAFCKQKRIPWTMTTSLEELASSVADS